MATNVIFTRGNTATINATAIKDGQILYNTTYGISQCGSSELIIPKRNNLFGNAANYDAGVSTENQAKNVSYGTV